MDSETRASGLPHSIYKKASTIVRRGNALHKAATLVLIINAIISFLNSFLTLDLPFSIRLLIGFINFTTAIADYLYKYEDHITLKGMYDEYYQLQFEAQSISGDNTIRGLNTVNADKMKFAIVDFIQRRNLYTIE